MKQASLLFFFTTCLLGGLFAQTNEQSIPRVFLQQGNIIGSLPYGQHFFLAGTTQVDAGKPVDRVTVEIWSTGKIQYNRKNRLVLPLKPAERERALKELKGASNLVATASWEAIQADDPGLFELYVGTPLAVRTQYLVIFDFYKTVVTALTDAEKGVLIEAVIEAAIEEYRKNEGISASSLQDLLERESKSFLMKKLNDSEEPFFSNGARTAEEVINVPVISPDILNGLSMQLGRYASTLRLVERAEQRLAAAEASLASGDVPPEEEGALREDIMDYENQIEQRQGQLEQGKADMRNDLQVIRALPILVKRVYTESQTEVSVPQLDAINIGTAFGSSVVGLNPLNSGSEDFDILSYSALKFYFLPVDKRMHDPYLNTPFISRLSFLLGVSFNGKIDYKGSELDDAIGFFPILGFSYDINRYFSLDLGATLFEQAPVSPLASDRELRVGPILGLTFDVDLFNRFKSTFDGGSSYLINPN